MMTTIPILRYHSVSTDPAPWTAPYAVAPATFARHVELITASGGTAMTLYDQMTAALALLQMYVNRVTATALTMIYHI